MAISNQPVRTSTTDGLNAVDVAGNAIGGHVDSYHVDLAVTAGDARFLFHLNILLALIIMVALNTSETLNFSPTMILFATMLRLGLNVASTRVVLLEGHPGGDSAAKSLPPLASLSSAETTWLASSFSRFS